MHASLSLLLLLPLASCASGPKIDAAPADPLPKKVISTSLSSVDAGAIPTPAVSTAVGNHCEQITLATKARPLTAETLPTFGNGDPCHTKDPSCGYDTTTRSCQPFVKVPQCPATTGEAQALQLFCMHPEQVALTCTYPDGPGITYECALPYFPPRGTVAPPGYYDVPKSWTGFPHYDEQGCPAYPTAYEERCKLFPVQECVTDYGVFRCVKRKWKMTKRFSDRP